MHLLLQIFSLFISIHIIFGGILFLYVCIVSMILGINRLTYNLFFLCCIIFFFIMIIVY